MAGIRGQHVRGDERFLLIAVAFWHLVEIDDARNPAFHVQIRGPFFTEFLELSHRHERRLHGVARVAFGITQRAGEHGRHRVVIFSGDGIELVIVAAGAGNRQAQKRFRRNVDLIVHHVIALERKILLGERFDPQGEKARGNDTAVPTPEFGSAARMSPASCSRTNWL